MALWRFRWYFGALGWRFGAVKFHIGIVKNPRGVARLRSAWQTPATRQQVVYALFHFGTQVVKQQRFRLQRVQQQAGVTARTASELRNMAEGKGGVPRLLPVTVTVRCGSGCTGVRREQAQHFFRNLLLYAGFAAVCVSRMGKAPCHESFVNGLGVASHFLCRFIRY